MGIRVRFAPSPTGQVHIGNIRTAIFNYLFARHNRGEFLVRIEDTDLERSTQDAIDKLFECMAWLGLDYDGEVMYQSKRSAAHLEAAENLRARGAAYYGKADENGSAPIYFCIPEIEDGELVRTVGEAEMVLHADSVATVDHRGVHFFTLSSKGNPTEGAGCLAGFRNLKIFNAANEVIFDLEKSRSEVAAGKVFELAGGVRMTFLRREVFYLDLVKGEMAKPLDSIKDQIIVRSDGSPIFHLANVLDDIAQEVTHIVRGDDHVENTYRHILLFHVLGAPVPVYAHLPMIVNQAGKPYSKRDGDAFVGDFRSKGFLALALFNYLSLLGWSPGDDREKMTKEELIEAFELDRAKSNPAQLDYNKLMNMNGLYIAEMPFEAFRDLCWSFFPGSAPGLETRFDECARLMQVRTKVFSQVASWGYFFSDEFEFDEKNCRKFFVRPEIRTALSALAMLMEEQCPTDAPAMLALVERCEKDHGFDHGKLFQAIRLACTGVAGGADLDRTLAIIGAKACAKRIVRALAAFPA